MENKGTSGAAITPESNFNILVSAGLRLTSFKGGGGNGG